MQQAEDLFQFDFSQPVYKNLIESLVNVCYFLRSISNYCMFCTEAIYSLSVSTKAPYAVVFALHSRSFGHRKIILQETHVILAKFWARIRAMILLEFAA